MDDARTNEALHELARLFLTDAARDRPPSETPVIKPNPPQARPADGAPSGPAAARLAPRAVLVGHLPGFANLWINQYAQQLAESIGPVGVVQVNSAGIDVDLFRPGLPVGGGPVGRHAEPDSLPEAVNAVAADVRQWLVYLTDPADPDMRRLARELEHWALLSGADEAAVVGAYRLLKQWLEPASLGLRYTSDPSVELVFLGCAADAADHAAAKLQRTAGQFLDLRLALGPVQQRMQPVNRRRIGSYDPLDHAGDLLDLLIVGDEIDPADMAAAIAPDNAQTAAEPYALHLSGSEETDADAAREIADPPADPPVPEPAAPRAEQPMPPAPLAGFVDGLTPLAARCPRAEHVDLALDERGRLHLLIHEDDQPLATLLATRAWAVEHAPLLALTVPDQALDTQAPPVLHLFTAAPKAFAPHADLVRLHLLLPVTVGDRTTVAHVELN